MAELASITAGEGPALDEQGGGPTRPQALARQSAICDTATMAHTPALDRFFRWLRGGRTEAPPTPPPTRAAGAPAHGLRHQRATRREQLFAMVREQMIRLGVLSSHYKFKVLTLDPAGEQFIVMVDWQPGAPAAADGFALRYESGLQQLLGERRAGFRVKAVYWRDAMGARAMSATPVPPPAAPSLPKAQAPAAVNPPPPAGDQVSDDELAAFRAALRHADGAQPGRPTGMPRPLAPQDMPEFAPTERIEDRDGHDVHESHDGTEFGSLSETQYGKL